MATPKTPVATPKMTVVGSNKTDRKDHIWVRILLPKGNKYKCVLCGAVSSFLPMAPTTEDFNPIKYEELTDDERNMVPFQLTTVLR